MKMNQREQLLWQVQTAGFAVYELNLYLDTHPCDAEALEAMKKYREQLEKCTNEYEATYGPLTAKSPYALCDRWKWTDAPMPWETEV